MRRGRIGVASLAAQGGGGRLRGRVCRCGRGSSSPPAIFTADVHGGRSRAGRVAHRRQRVTVRGAHEGCSRCSRHCHCAGTWPLPSTAWEGGVIVV